MKFPECLSTFSHGAKVPPTPCYPRLPGGANRGPGTAEDAGWRHALLSPRQPCHPVQSPDGKWQTMPTPTPDPASGSLASEQERERERKRGGERTPSLTSQPHHPWSLPCLFPLPETRLSPRWPGRSPTQARAPGFTIAAGKHAAGPALCVPPTGILPGRRRCRRLRVGRCCHWLAHAKPAHPSSTAAQASWVRQRTWCRKRLIELSGLTR